MLKTNKHINIELIFKTKLVVLKLTAAYNMSVFSYSIKTAKEIAMSSSI